MGSWEIGCSYERQRKKKGGANGKRDRNAGSVWDKKKRGA